MRNRAVDDPLRNVRASAYDSTNRSAIQRGNGLNKNRSSQSGGPSRAPCGRLIAIWLCLIPLQSIAAINYAPPDDSPDLANELRITGRELAGNSYSAAAKRLSALLEKSAEALVPWGEEGAAKTSMTVSAWVDQLPAAQRKALREECNKEYGHAARLSLESARRGAGLRAEELYAIARRYPLTDASAQALTEAGDLSARLGDLRAAKAYFDMAIREGAALDDSRVKLLNWLTQIELGETIAPPKDLEGFIPPARPAGLKSLAGPLPIDAPWYANPALAGLSKFFPIAAADGTILASWNRIVLIRDNGQLAWSASNPKAPGAFAADRSLPTGRGAIFQPAVQTDLFGRAAIVIARQPNQNGDDQFGLRAYAGSDGRLLWASETADPRKDLTYISSPAIAGRAVYTVAAARVNQSAATLILCANDSLTGQPLWQTPLGAIREADIRFGRADRAGYIEISRLAELSEPAIWRDLAIISPNCGAVIAVGRFDGKIRWIHVYGKPNLAEAPLGVGRVDRRDIAARVLEERNKLRNPALRYRSTPGICEIAGQPSRAVVVAMPQDARSVYGLDALTGQFLWDIGEERPWDGISLAGVSAEWMAFAGEKMIYGGNAATGKLMWEYTPPAGVTLTGPPTVMRQTVLVPTSAGIVQLNVADGKEHKDVDLAPWLKLGAAEGWKSTLKDLNAEKAIGKR